MSSTTTLCPVILAGGGGSRLWPLSRRRHPKQLIPLCGERSLLQETLLRCIDMDVGARLLPPQVVCNEEHRFTAAQQLQEINAVSQPLILEPAGRNTAPALTAAALVQSRQGEDPVLLMLPADHFIAAKNAFHRALAAGVGLVRDGRIVVFGVAPSGANTGYGYLERGADLGGAAFQVAGFREKPDAARALEYAQSGRHYWNSGIFMLRASTWLAALEALQPDILQACTRACDNGVRDGDFVRLEEQAFAECPAVSVDYAVMERLDQAEGFEAAAVALDAGWSDAGAWDEVWRLGAQDENHNVVDGDAMLLDSTNSLVRADARLVAVAGCDNLAVVETADAVLVLNKERPQEVRRLVAALDAAGRPEADLPRCVQRPWGSYETVAAGRGYQVKRLAVLPGKRLSLQLHRRRSEHWVVVSGTAAVTRGDEVFDLQVNESTFIPAGVKHRLHNRTGDALEIIEVQVGDYLGEDDIVRFEDDFNRAPA